MRSPLRRWLTLAASTVALSAALEAHAGGLPTGGAVAQGAVSLGSPSAGALTIHQTSSKAVIDWTSFSIGAGNSVQFNNGAGSTLNRVTGAGGSEIDGALNATGSVYLINPGGVIIGKTGVVKVGGGFVATTLDVSDGAYEAGGALTFSGRSSSAVLNLGRIEALGGDVVLAAKAVENDGQISAPAGDAGLLGASQVTLSDTLVAGGKFQVALGSGGSVTNTGQITAALAELRAAGGNVYALAGDTRGVIDATGVTTNQGQVFLVAEAGTVDLGGTITARGPGGAGGRIETSGQTVNIGAAQIDAGGGGTWSLDPTDLTINQTAANTIDAALDAGTDVTQSTSAAGTGGQGDILVSPNVSLTWTTSASLALSAYRDITVGAGAAITSTLGGAVTLQADNTGTGMGTISFGAGALISTTGATSLFYDPSVNPTGGGVNATSYVAPTETYKPHVSGGTLTAYMLVNTLADLQNMQNNLAGTYALGRDIDATATASWNGGAGFSPIGTMTTPFTGVLNGREHVVSDLTIDRPTTQFIGLFGYVDQPSVIENVGLVGGSITGQEEVGALIGGTADSAFAPFTPTRGVQVLNSYSTAAVVGTGEEDVGGLIGYAYLSLISSSHANGPVSAPYGEDVGGLVGTLISGEIEDSYATGSVQGQGGVGGLVGGASNAEVFRVLAPDGLISESYATGAVSGYGDVGGLAGAAFYCPISDSYALGSVTASAGSGGDELAGGLIGLMADESIVRAYATGAVKSPGSSGGLVGQAFYYLPPDPTFSLNSATSLSVIESSYWDTQTTGQSVGVNWTSVRSGDTPPNPIGLTTAQFGQVSSFITPGTPGETGFIFTTTPGAAGWVIVDQDGTLNNAGGVAGATRPMLASEYSTTVTNDHQLQLMAMALSANYSLASDVSMDEIGDRSGAWITDLGFVPVGSLAAPFTGTLDGQGHTISDLTIDAVTDNLSYVGLFGVTGESSLITNVNLSGVSISGPQYVGGLVADGTGTISNVTVSGQFNLSNDVALVPIVYMGAVAAYNYGSITNAASSGTLTDQMTNDAGYNGGLIGKNYGSIAGSSSTANLQSENDDLGGLVGWNTGSIVGSSASGAITNPSAGIGTAGLVAYNQGSIQNSFATARLSMAATMGGLVDGNDGSITNSYAIASMSGGALDMGGLVGFNLGTISQSYASGTVAGPNTENEGGLVGENYASGVVRNSYSIAQVTCQSVCTGYLDQGSQGGGLIGDNNGGQVSNVYASGAVIGGFDSTGGLIGVNTGTVTDGYWDTQTTGRSSSAGGTGLTTAQFANTGNFAGFTFTTTPGGAGWVIVDQNSTLNNADGAAGATRPMLASEYSTTIANGHQLQLMALDLSANYSLAANLDLSAIRGSSSDIWITAEGFAPLGNLGGVAPWFTGALDGDGYTIANLYVNGAAAGLEHAGLFGLIGPGGQVSDLALTGAQVSGSTNVGALAGRAFDPAGIIDVSVAGSVSGVTSIGGVLGYLDGGQASDLTSAASVTGSGVQIGGLVGAALDTDISLSSASGAVTGGGDVGGLVGWTSDGLITTSDATGAVRSNRASAGANFGGLVGDFFGGSLTQSYATGAVTTTAGAAVHIGGLIGQIYRGAISGVYATGAVTVADSSSAIGGLVGNVVNGQIAASHATGAVNGGNFSGDVGGLAGDADALSTISGGYATGAVTVGASVNTPDDPHGNPNALTAGIGGLVGDSGATITQSYAAGTVTSDGETDGIGGLVGLNTGVLSHVYATGAVFGNGVNFVGGLVASNHGTISGAYATGAVIGGLDTGGLAGANSGSIANAYSTSSVEGESQFSYTGQGPDLGGLVGVNSGSITGGWASGAVAPAAGITEAQVGGLVGANRGSITQSYATGAVNGADAEDAGGLVGGDSGGAIAASYATGAVSANTLLAIGGLVGLEDGEDAISKSYASGAVSVSGLATYAGGLVGFSYGAITQSYALGSVTVGAGSIYVGGLVGGNLIEPGNPGGFAGSITQAYATGKVTAPTGALVGGLAGGGTGAVSGGYWDTQTTGQSASEGGTGLTTAQFADTANFPGLTFTTTPGAAGWVIVDQNGTLNNAGGAAGATRPMLASEYSTTIANGHQLQLVAMDLGANYTVAANLDLSAIRGDPSEVWITAEGFSPLGNLGGVAPWFTGAFDGDGYTIANLYVNGAAAGLEHAGLFGVIGPDGEVRDLSLTGAQVSGTSNVGALAGRVFGYASVGGISVSGSVSGTISVGGVVGYLSGGLASELTSTATVTGSTGQIGGLVGYMINTALGQSSASGAVTGGGDIGGAVGRANSSNLLNLAASGTVTATADGAGGLIGDLYGDLYGIGLDQSYATGAVRGLSDIGGLAGRTDAAAVIDNAYAAGSVSGTSPYSSQAGGLVGDGAGRIENSYATGAVTAPGLTGGLVGYYAAGGEIVSSYWNLQTTGQSHALGGGTTPIEATGLTTTQMTQLGRYDDWDFTLIWYPPASAPPQLRLAAAP